MEIEIADASGLPEALKPVWSDGKLDLAKLMVAEDLTGLKSALVSERAHSQEWKDIKAEFGTPSDIRSKMQELQDAAKRPAKGAEELQAKLDQVQAAADAKVAAANERLSSFQRSATSSMLQAELAKAGFIAESIDDITATAMGRIQFGDDGAPRVMTADGKPMIGSGADHGATLADLATELAKAKPYAVRDGGKGGSGTPPGKSGGTPDNKSVTRSEFDSMSQFDRAEFAKSGGKVTD